MVPLHRRSLLIGGAALVPAVSLVGLSAETLADTMIAPATHANLAVTENPFGPSAAARQAIIESVGLAPDYVENERAFRTRIADVEGLSFGQVALCSGSLDALSLLSCDIARGGYILAPQPTYSTHLAYAQRRGIPTRFIPLTNSHSIDLASISAAITADTRMVYLCNPNNPTGLLADPVALRRFCETVSKRIPVIIDEAYFELAPNPSQQTMASLVRTGSDVIVVRTFSKVYGMAGLRIGYILAQPARIKQLDSLATTSRNQLGFAAARACLGDPVYLAGAVAYLEKCRSIIDRICTINQLTCLPSQGTFVYIDTGRPALLVQHALAAAGVAVRLFDGPAYTRWIRVGTATPPELALFGRVLPDVLRQIPKT